MTDIIQFKTRSQKIEDWFNEVVSRNGLLKDKVKSAVLIWEEEKNNTPVCMVARHNCDTEEFNRFCQSMQEQNLKNKMDKFLIENISNYIQYL